MRPTNHLLSAPRPPLARRVRRGFTLIEGLMASGILLMVVLTVTSAIGAGQQNALEANQRISASLAAEELLSRIVVEDYASLASWHKHSEPIGEMLDMNGNPMPDMFGQIGRSVTVQTDLHVIEAIDCRVRGRTVTVECIDRTGRVLSELVQFIPEPPS